MNEAATAPPIAAERQCALDQALDWNFIELLQLAPKNPQVRALLLRLTGMAPGPDLETFEQIKEWIEAGWKPPARRAAAAKHGLSIHVDFSDVGYGRADYSVRRSATGSFRLSPEETLEIVEAAVEEDGGLDQVVAKIAQRVEDGAWDQCDPDMEDDGDYNYSDHDTSGSEDSQTDFSHDQIREAVVQFLRAARPDLLNSL